MQNFNEMLKKAAEKMGRNVVFEGLLSKNGVIRNGCGENAEDVLGFNYTTCYHQQCYSFYAANPPRDGMTQPTPVFCPTGIRVFNHYKVDYKEAIRLLNTINAGNQFTRMSLYWPLTPEATEPCWHFQTTIGNHVVIGANSGKVNQFNFQMEEAATNA
ncbi:MAG: hypothetical protein ACEPOZ_15395 [Marinifilaceae bacterium]|jgi:hypothetical protein